MFRIILSGFLVFLLLSEGKAQEVQIVKFDQVEELMKSSTHEYILINFWATWCAPCVKEIPIIEKFAAENTQVSVTFISLDFASKVDKVTNFVTRKKMKSRLLLLDDLDYNSWISKVDPSWQGTIPATLLINTKTQSRQFVAQELAPGELEKLLTEIK